MGPRPRPSKNFEKSFSHRKHIAEITSNHQNSLRSQKSERIESPVKQQVHRSSEVRHAGHHRFPRIGTLVGHDWGARDPREPTIPRGWHAPITSVNIIHPKIIASSSSDRQNGTVNRITSYHQSIMSYPQYRLSLRRPRNTVRISRAPSTFTYRSRSTHQGRLTSLEFRIMKLLSIIGACGLVLGS